MPELPKTRVEAKNVGAKHYFTGAPCLRGHISKRFTSNGTCFQCSQDFTQSQIDSGYYKQRYDANKDEILAKNRKRYRDSPDVRKRVAEQAKEWVKNNPQKVRHVKQAYKARRRSIKRQGASGADVSAWVEAQQKVCYWCNSDCAGGYHVDHYVPLSKGGAHEVDNLVIACPSCNLTKSSKDPYKFAQEVGRLF